VKRQSFYHGKVGDYGLEEAQLPNGMTVTLEILRHVGAAAVVPLHDDGSVTLIWQHRHATGGSIWEVPAGKLDPGEAPEHCALRELVEEAGLAAGRCSPLSTIYTTPAFTDEQIHLFLAEDLKTVPQALEADEVISVRRMPLSEALSMIQRGEITDAKTLCALMLTAQRLGKIAV